MSMTAILLKLSDEDLDELRTLAALRRTNRSEAARIAIRETLRRDLRRAMDRDPRIMAVKHIVTNTDDDAVPVRLVEVAE
jgi:metal-responsive CopG/Arc/MetJ family transcriptional regulator